MNLQKFSIAPIGLWLWLSIPLSWGNSASKAESEGEEKTGPGERITKIIEGHQSAMKIAFKQRREAQTPVERSAVEMPDPKNAVKVVIFLLDKAPDDPVAKKTVLWIARHGMQYPDLFPEIEDLITKHFTNMKGLENICLTLSYYGSDMTTGLLEHIINNSKNTNAVAASLFSMAMIKANANDQDDAVKYLERIVKAFPEEKVGNQTIADMASDQLFAIRNLAIGKIALEIEGKTIDDNPIKLSDYRGKVVVVKFFGHWNGPCRSLYPQGRSLVEKFKDKPFSFIGVSSDSKATLKEIIENKKVTWECIWDNGSTTGPIATNWNVRNWPAIFVIDHERIIRHKNLHGESLESAIETLLEKVPATKE